MKLLTKELIKQFPKLYANEDKKPENVKVIAKFFTPDSNFTWYATEFDGKDIFFGYVEGHDKELGYFSLAELQKVRGRLGLPVERDMHFRNRTLAMVMGKQPLNPSVYGKSTTRAKTTKKRAKSSIPRMSSMR